MPRITLIVDRHVEVAPQGTNSGEAPLLEALRERGADAEVRRWEDTDASTLDTDLVLVRRLDLDPGRREDLLAWAHETSTSITVLNPVDVLRWNSHRSYLLELEDRGAPLVPTAWMAQGDRIDLGALLERRGWSRALVQAAVPGAEAAGTIVTADQVAAGQLALDGLLQGDDATLQALPTEGDSAELTSAIVVDGKVVRLVRRGAGLEPVESPDAAALASWVVEATGVDLLVARVDLRSDELGTWQLVAIDAAAPDVPLERFPDLAGTIADAILRRTGAPPDGGPG